MNHSTYQSSARPNFNGQNANPSNFNNQNAASMMGSFATSHMSGGPLPFVPGAPSFPMMMHNNQMDGFPQLGQLGINPAAARQNLNQILALQLLGQAQNMNVLASLQMGGNALWNNGMSHNFNQLGGMPNMPVNFLNPMMQGNRMNMMNIPMMGGAHLGSGDLGIMANPQMGAGNCNLTVDNVRSSFGSSSKNQKFEGKPHGSMNKQRTMKHQENGNQQSQSFRAKSGFGRSGYTSGRKDQTRFQNSLSQNAKAMKRNGQFNKFNKKGGNFRSMKFSEPILPQKPRIVVKYSQAEIRLWVEARKRNFPTRANVEKKLTRKGVKSEDSDSDAKLRRQQLKEVLHKQAELGVEVAELPPGYLLDSEIPASKGQNGPKGSSQNQHSKRPSTSKGREPTLLQKLLSAEIKRDKHKLFQVFRFMVQNSFFVELRDKPLEFPIVTVKGFEPEGEITTEDTEQEPEVADSDTEKTTLVNENPNPDECDASDGTDSSSEDDSKDVHGSITKCGKPEEGEITE